MDRQAEGFGELPQLVEQLTTRIEQLEGAQPSDRLVLGVLSGNLDTTMAAFIIALGATAYDMEVDMFFTFWGTAALRDPKKNAKKNLLGKMFGWMLPRGSRKLPLSKMQMAGMGPKMIRWVMKSHGGKSLEELIEEAGKAGVRLHVCEMSMGVMGLKEEELIDYPHLELVGVGSFIALATDAKAAFFL